MQHFGTERCFCGGDWPVSELAGSYSKTWSIYKEVINDLIKEKEAGKKYFIQMQKIFMHCKIILYYMEVIQAVLYHAVGASSAALCYTPQKKLVNWSWQTYWLAQAFICWLVLPVVIAFITIPQLLMVLKEAPASAMQNSFLLGMAYGIGGTAFGIAIRYVGFSLTYAIAVGISCVLGTLLPPLVHGTLSDVLKSNGAAFLISGWYGGIGIASVRCCRKEVKKKTWIRTTMIKLFSH